MSDISDSNDNDDRHPFPTARVTKLIRAEAGDKMVSSKVKMATNQFLADIASIVSEEMNKTAEKTVNMDDFVRAARPYTYAANLEREHAAVVSELENVRIRMDKLIREFRHKFEMVDERDFKVGHEEISGAEASSATPAAVEEKKKGPSLADLSDDELGI